LGWCPAGCYLWSAIFNVDISSRYGNNYRPEPPYLSKLVAGLVTYRLLPVVSHPQHGYQFKVGKQIKLEPPFLSKLVAGMVTCRLLPVISHPQHGYQFKEGKLE
jgi:hypothetical protein